MNKDTPKKTTEGAGALAESASAFFNQTYYLFLILFVLHFFFSVYLFYKIKAVERGGTGTPAQVQGAADAAAPAGPTVINAKKPSKDEPWRGPDNARFVLIEYSDLECPFCASVHPDLKKLVEETTDMAWVYRHFPLSFHPKAQKFAEATECAFAQGGLLGGNSNDNFWTLADAIVEQQQTLQTSGVPALAGQLGMDEAAIQSCMDSGEMAQKVSDDMTEASSAGVGATPTIVIYDMETGNSKTIEGALPYESIKAEYDALKAGN